MTKTGLKAASTSFLFVVSGRLLMLELQIIYLATKYPGGWRQFLELVQAEASIFFSQKIMCGSDSLNFRV